MTSKSKARRENPDGSMTLGAHLRELRHRVIICLLALLAGFVVCLGLAPRLVQMLTDMGVDYGYAYVYIAPQELLMVYFTLALVGGLVIAFPFIGYHIYAFCGPGLTKRERRYMLGALTLGTLFFLLGELFAYFVSVPFMLRFLISFSTQVNVSAAISIQEYVNFLITVFLIFGLVFELPVISVLLTMLGVLKVEWMVKARKVMIVIIFLIAAIITPPDVASQIMVAVPMIALYELSILLCRLFRRRKTEDSGQ